MKTSPTPEEREKARADALKYRQENFTIRIEDGDGWIAGEKNLLISHNGRQWNSIGLTRDEALRVCLLLQEEFNIGH